MIDTDKRTINNLSQFFVAHYCSICNAPVGYRLAPSEIAIVFDSTCQCTEKETLRLVSYDEFSDFMKDKDRDKDFTESNESNDPDDLNDSGKK